MFQRAAAATNDSLAAKARFNLGNTHYARALASLQSPAQASAQTQTDKPAQPDTQAAIEQLGLAIDQYRSSLRINPADSDARANIELAEQADQAAESNSNSSRINSSSNNSSRTTATATAATRPTATERIRFSRSSSRNNRSRMPTTENRNSSKI